MQTLYYQRFKAPRFACTSHAFTVAMPSSEHKALFHTQVGSLTEGAAIHLTITMDEQQTVQHACFKAYGCPAVIASADYACEWLQGRSIAEFMTINAAQLSTALQLVPAKFHAAVMAVQALQQLADQLAEPH